MEWARKLDPSRICDFGLARGRNLFKHSSRICFTCFTSLLKINHILGTYRGFWVFGGPSKKFLSDLSHWASVASTGRAGFDREDDEWLRTEYVGTRWYRAPEARGERMLILSGIFELLVGGEKKPWMRQNNWLQVSTNHSQTSWRLWRSDSHRIPTKHPQALPLDFRSLGTQVVLTSSEYTAAIDMWSVGCILGELMGRKVMFLA